MSQHDEIISGAACSVSLFIVSVFPTITKIAHGLDVYIVLVMHLLQTIAAFAAIVVAFYTVKKMVREHRNSSFK